MKNNIRRIENILFKCESCGPFVNVLTEVTSELSDGPIKIEFVQHDDYGAVIVDEIEIAPKIGEKFSRSYFCGCCGSLVRKMFNTKMLCS